MKRIKLQIAAAADVLLRVTSASTSDFKCTLTSKASELLNLQVRSISGAVLETISLGIGDTASFALDNIKSFELFTFTGNGQVTVTLWCENDFSHAVKRIQDAHEVEFLDYLFLESSSSSQNSSSSSSSSNSSSSSINSSSSSPSSGSSSSSSPSSVSSSSSSSKSSSSSSSPSSNSSSSSSSSSANSSSSSSSNSSSSPAND